MRKCAILTVLFLSPAVVAEDEKKSVVKEIPTKDLKLNVGRPMGGKATEPTVVKSAADLAKVAALTPDAVKGVEKEVDFGMEKLLVFWWAGSGQDKIEVTGETKDGKTTLKVDYTRGRTRDLRTHFKLFAVPKDAELAK